MSDWAAGTEVRLVAEPGTVGFCTGVSRQRGETLMVQVAFPGLGKTFQAAYELEPVAATPGDPFTLAAQGRYGGASHLRRNLTHIQLSGRLANLVYSMATTHTDYYAYQYKPVLAFLESPANGLLIADEVGLGKTIEAGLVWTEIRARLDARRLVVVCPAMLREKWKDELARRFGVDAELINAAELVRALQQPRSSLPDGRAIVCSLQGLRPPRGWQDDGGERSDAPRRKLAHLLRDSADGEPLIDLLVVDEAHYLRNPGSLTWRLGQLLREVSAHVLLLSATPINLSSEDLFTLLNLIDPDTFRFRDFFPDLLYRNEPLVRAREHLLDRSSTEESIKELLREAWVRMQGDGAIADRHRSLAALLETPMPAEFLEDTANRVKMANRVERVNLLGHVVVRTRKAEVSEFRVVRRPHTEVVPMTEAEERLYRQVTASIRNYARERGVSDGFLLAPPQRQVSSCMVAAVRAWRAGEGVSDELLYEDFGVERDGDHETPLIDTLAREVLPDVDLRELEKRDSKYQRLLSVLRGYFADEPDEKVIVFSFFRGTVKYLNERLTRDGVRAQMLMGGMTGGKQAAIDRFRDDASVRVLLSSEVAAEGVDLQFCRMLVNYDLPWNPMKVEQRIGRIDRIGQKSESIVVWNLCSAGTIDERILARLYQRLQIFERALGGLEAVLGEQIQELTGDLLSRSLSPQEENERIDRTALAIETIRDQQERLEAQAGNLIAHGGYILDAVHAAHEFSRRITDQDLFVYVRDFLERHARGHTLQQVSSGPDEVDLRLPPDVAARLADFIVARRLSGQTELATGDVRRCRFINKVQLRRERTEQISQFHPLIRFISQELDRLGESFYPVLAARLPVQWCGGTAAAGHYAFAVQRWSFRGLRTEEELRARLVDIATKVPLGEEASLNVVNQARARGEDWAAAANVLAGPPVVAALDVAGESLAGDFREAVQVRSDENYDRVAMQRESLTRHLERRLARLEQTLAVHQERGRKALVSATRGQIEKLSNRVQMQLEGLSRRAVLERSQFDVCMGVIELY